MSGWGVDAWEGAETVHEAFDCPECGKDSCEDPSHLEGAGDGLDLGRDGQEPSLPTVGSERPALEFLPVRELAARVEAAGPRKYLLRGLWPAGDGGVIAAEAKAQKTWTTVDLDVSVASGTPWLGLVEVDDPGPVLMFAGEGGQGNILRRLEATARGKGVSLLDLPITVCTRAPHLGDAAHLELVAKQLAAVRPHLVSLDPLYLSARGAKMSDLYAMGEVLEEVQLLCQDVGAALCVTTHFNRKDGQGAKRILGSGPWEWGRVLLTAKILSRHTNAETKASDVLMELEAIGGEIGDRTLRVRRRIWADDPDDLNSPLHLEVEAEDVEVGAGGSGGEDGPSPAARKLLEALEAVGPATNTVLVDWIAKTYGHGLTRPTVSKELNKLEREGAVCHESDGGQFSPKTWSLARV